MKTPIAAGNFSEEKDQQITRIPGDLIYMDPKEKNKYVIVVEKSSQQLFLYGNHSGFKEIFHFNCSTGELKGPKRIAGDKKTPEGVYFVVDSFTDKQLTPVYGTRAFPIDYPNLIDKIEGLSGTAIWLHGTNKPLKPRDSNGCIAMQNEDIDRLAKHIRLTRTPVLIVDKITYILDEEKNRIKMDLINFIQNWSNAISLNSYHNYLSYYSPNYLPPISWWPEWHKLKKKVDQENSDKASLEIYSPSIFKDKDIFVVMFDHVLKNKSKRLWIGYRKLFIKKENSRYKIIGDDFQAELKDETFKQNINPLLYAISRFSNTKEEKGDIQVQKDYKREIKVIVNSWLAAWSSKNIKKYGRFYARDFYGNGKNKRQWILNKNRLNKRYRNINVTQKNLKIYKKSKNRSVATFIQTYVSSGHRAKGKKTLIFKREKGQWKIYREMWKKI